MVGGVGAGDVVAEGDELRLVRHVGDERRHAVPAGASASHSGGVSAMFVADTSQMATWHPSAASWRASSRPMPVPPPVTTASLPCERVHRIPLRSGGQSPRTELHGARRTRQRRTVPACTPMEVARAAAALGGPWPSEGGEPVFDEPWEGRAFALALDLVDGLGLPWDEFRRRLMAAIDDDPQRPYYESWLVALERLAIELPAPRPTSSTLIACAPRPTATTKRATATSRSSRPAVSEHVVGRVSHRRVRGLVEHIRFGPAHQRRRLRAAFAPHRRAVDARRLSHGRLRRGHVHLCIGAARGVARPSGRRRTSPVDGAASTPSCNGNGSRARRASWMFRMFNGDGASSSPCCSRTRSSTATTARSTCPTGNASSLGCAPPALPRSAADPARSIGPTASATPDHRVVRSARRRPPGSRRRSSCRG